MRGPDGMLDWRRGKRGRILTFPYFPMYIWVARQGPRQFAIHADCSRTTCERRSRWVEAIKEATGVWQQAKLESSWMFTRNARLYHGEGGAWLMASHCPREVAVLAIRPLAACMRSLAAEKTEVEVKS